jgi:ElaB/YqjD/DUF883 family membrane-anchored ribosome-binding protein
MNAQVLTPTKANFKLTLLDAEAESVLSSDLYLWLCENGLPSEVAIRLKDLIDVTAKVADRVINVGKIILIKIIEFVKAHPNLATGIAVGAAIGALVSMIPFLGVYLAPIATAIAVTIGAIAGYRLDKIEHGQTANKADDLVTIGQDVIEIAKVFFKLLIDIFNTIFEQQLLGQV